MHPDVQPIVRLVGHDDVVALSGFEPFNQRIFQSEADQPGASLSIALRNPAT